LNYKRKMAKLEEVILRTIHNLKKTNKLDEIILSKSSDSSRGIELSKSNNKQVEDYISNLDFAAYFHNTKQPKYSWHQLNGMIKPIINAGTIEICKILPYFPFLDKNNFYRAVGAKIGKDTTIAPRVQFDYFHPELIEIGNNCVIGDGVKLWTHDYGRNYFMLGSIKVGDDVEIGSESLIGPSVIGKDCKINARSFVYGNIPENAKVLGQIMDEKTGRSKYIVK
jgi:acetyltransferase-like isoleucine patch superfamily enzyme